MRKVCHSFDVPGCKPCPVCGNKSCVEGEYVDVGVGSIKCSPDTCDVCGYAEMSPHAKAELDGFTFEMIEKCWELQVWPWGQYEEPQ